MPSRERQRRSDAGLAGRRDREGEDRVQVEARGGDQDDRDDERGLDGAVPDMELAAFEDVHLQVEQREPDPHRRQNLDQGEPPVRDEQLEALEEQDERAEREYEGRQAAAG